MDSRDAGSVPGHPRAERPRRCVPGGFRQCCGYETPAGACYFKAAAHRDTAGNAGTTATPHRSFLFANEASLLAGLAERLPDHVPSPIATDPQRVWMLLPDAGPALATSDDLDAWEAALRLHARHQRAFAGKVAELLRIGCLDRRLNRLAAHLDDLATDEADCRSSTRHAATVSTPRFPPFGRCSTRPTSLDLPDTLVHGDFHAGNIGLRRGRAVYFDWTDACVAPPFLDLVTFLDESEVLDAAPGARERLRAAYLEEWQGVVTAAALARAAALAEPIGMLHQAVSYHHMLSDLEDPTRSAMGSGVTYWVGRLLDWLAGLARGPPHGTGSEPRYPAISSHESNVAQPTSLEMCRPFLRHATPCPGRRVASPVADSTFDVLPGSQFLRQRRPLAIPSAPPMQCRQ